VGTKFGRAFFPARGDKGASPETRGGAMPELPASALGHDSAGFDYFCSDHHYRHVVAAIIRHLAKGCRFLLVTGPPGAGGEFIARFLDEATIGGYRSTLVGCHPGMDFRNLASAYGQRLGLDAEDDSGGLLWTLLSHLMRELRNGTKRVLVLERADELDAVTFNELLRFTQLDTPRLMPVVLLASPTLVERLETPPLAFLRAAIGGSIALQWLAPEEVGAFIQYQLKTTPEAALFPPETIVAIAEAAHGDPAIVNRLAREVVSSAKPVSNEVSSPGAPESAGADGEAAKGAPPLVDGAASQAFAGRTGDTCSSSTDFSGVIGASALGDRITIDGPGRQNQDTAQMSTRTGVTAVNPSDTGRLRPERVDSTARALVPTDEVRATDLAKVSLRRKRGQFRLPLSAVVAGYFLVSVLVGGALLYHIRRGLPNETASPAAAVVIGPVETRAPEPVAAAPNPAGPTSDASVSAGAPAAAAQFAFAPTSPAEPVSEPVASQSPELQAITGEVAAAGPASDSPTASVPRAAEIGSSGNDSIPAASAPPGLFVPVPGVEAADTVSAAETQVIGAAPAVSAPPPTLPDLVPPAPATPMTPPPALGSGEPEAMAPAREISALGELAPTLPPIEPPPITALPSNAHPTTPEQASPAAAAQPMSPAVASSSATDRTAPSNEIVATVEPAPPPRSGELPPSADVAVMVRRGNQLLAAGDVISARRFFERAAAAGDAAAACGVGKSFDPLFLRQMGARGLSGDAVTAIVWYRKATEAGNREAQERLRRLGGQGEVTDPGQDQR
jgi:type II secretory pathway predicted ATPase ExeA